MTETDTLPIRVIPLVFQTAPLELLAFWNWSV